MNQINHFKQGNSLVLLTVCLSSLLVSACAGNAVKEEKISDAESCTLLQGIIADHPNKFKSYKKTYSSHRAHSSWTADKIVPSAKICQVWEWSTGLHNYVCEWEGADESTTIANDQEINRVIETCLGSAWTTNTNTTQNGSKTTIYSNGNSPTVVSVRYFKETGGWRSLQNWSNTLIIGDKNNLKSPLH